MKTNRRNFLKVAGSASGSLIVPKGIAHSGPIENYMKFISPIDGDMLNEYDGKVVDGSLIITVKILASTERTIKVNKTQAIYKHEEGLFLADISLKNYRNDIEVVESNTGDRQKITVYWLKNYSHKYRLSLDDNILFLRDISFNAKNYKSIFDNPYLNFFKQVHDTYGTKVHFNIYYQTEGFNLSQMTDKFKNEWKENADWIRLSFHALQNDPDLIYINSGYNQVKKDCEMVMGEIYRFAGDELTGQVTTLHWGTTTVEGCRALRDMGFSGLVGYFHVENLPVGYYLDLGDRCHIKKRCIWKDNREGIIFVKNSMVIDRYKLEDIQPSLDLFKKTKTDLTPSYTNASRLKSQEKYEKNTPQSGLFIELMMHEQYFDPSFYKYQPDAKHKILTAVKWAVNNGYKPAFISECI